MSRATRPFGPSVVTTIHASAELPVGKGRCHLSPADLDSLADQLDTMRRELAGEIAQLQQRSFFAAVGPSDPDAEWNSAMAARSVGDKRGLLFEMDQARTRISNNTFGLCPIDAQPIPRERLVEMPWVKYCEHCATHAGPGVPMDAFGVIRKSAAPVMDLAD